MLRYLGGNPDFDLGVPELRELAGQVLSGRVTDRSRGVVLAVLGAHDDAVLGRLLEDGQLRRVLMQEIPQGHALRPELEQFFAERLDATGQVRTDVQPPLPFSPGLVRNTLADIRLHDALTPDRLHSLPEALAVCHSPLRGTIVALV